MEEKKLYPFKFAALEDKYVWGSEEFLLADLGYRDSFIKNGWLTDNSLSELMDMYMDRVVGENTFTYYGRQFPFQVKRIVVNGGKMPLRVHPDDETAGPRYDFLGKEKIWYIRKADTNSGLYLGLSKDSDAGELVNKCTGNDLESILNVRKVEEGEYISIHPGTIHGAFGKMEIIEISESSPLDFCIYSWGLVTDDEEFDPAFDMTDALDFIDYKAYDNAEDQSIAHFTARTIKLNTALKVRPSKEDTCACYLALKGKTCLQTDLEIILIPADIEEFSLIPMTADTEIMEILPSKRIDKDSYTGE